MLAQLASTWRAASASLGDAYVLKIVLIILLALGLHRVLTQVGNLLSGLWRCFVRPGKNLKKFGSWAVVTGATDGIGLAFAQELARKGLNVVLVARNRSRLDSSAKLIKTKHQNIEVEIVEADFSSDQADLYQRINQQLAAKDIGILVNNVGVSYPHAQYLYEVDDTVIQNLIDVNVNATTQMTRIVLPGMIKRRRGAIVNISSAAGLLPTGDPLYAVYSATKAYVDFFSRSLHFELKSKGIHVQCQVPYFVVSKLSKLRSPSLFTPTPAGYARAGVRAIGYEPTVVPYWSHALQHSVLHSLPTGLLSQFILNHHHGVYKRALAKKAREQGSNESKSD